MSDKTGIEWTDATWNPIRGCSRVSEGCRHCYAESQAARIISMDRGRGIPEGKGAYDGLLAKGGQWNGNIKFVESVMDQPLRWKKPRMIFVNSMSDLFHEGVPDEVIDQVFTVMAAAPHHTFQILTKRPERMRRYMRNGSRPQRADGNRLFAPDLTTFVDWPLPNVWLGVSVEDQATADERIPPLIETPSAVRWLSMEPLLGPVAICSHVHENGIGRVSMDGIDWVVVGGESGKKARPMHPDWACSLRDQCAAAGVPFLFKQWGEWIPMLGQAEGVSVRGEKHIFDDGTVMGWAGKKSAGRLLDGKQHDEYPRAAA